MARTRSSPQRGTVSFLFSFLPTTELVLPATKPSASYSHCFPRRCYYKVEEIVSWPRSRPPLVALFKENIQSVPYLFQALTLYGWPWAVCRYAGARLSVLGWGRCVCKSAAPRPVQLRPSRGRGDHGHVGPYRPADLENHARGGLRIIAYAETTLTVVAQLRQWLESVADNSEWATYMGTPTPDAVCPRMPHPTGHLRSTTPRPPRHGERCRPQLLRAHALCALLQELVRRLKEHLGGGKPAISRR